MDKKGNRSLPSPKGPASDSKKDVVSKQWPRGGRRREPTAGSLSIKGEPSRKPQPQRDRAFDKRPKPRGTYHATTLGRIEAAGVELDEAELGSVFLPGSKKQSLNHLLNFSYTPYSPRESYQSERSKDKGGHWLATKKHTYNKEHFLQANCQFIVSDSGDYKQYLNNPDALVDWSLVEQVNVQVSEFPSCPICLYPPAAAKMTRCGHIYCWSCVLHYLSLSDKASRKCPICHECVLKQDLKSVVAVPHSTFNVNETITFKLMKRPRGCLTAYPADAEVRDDHAVFNMSDKEAGRVYSKLLLANGGDILSIIARERRELEAQIADEENRPETCFIEQAFVALNGRETSVLEKIHSLIESDSGEDLKTDGGTAGVAELVDHLNISGDVAGQQPKFHFFYQASDGQHIYLNSVNAKMLEHTYGSLEFGPVTITGRILEKEGGSMTEELRIRFKYLQHLPVTCQFEVAEIQLKPPIISRETMEHFKDKIESRRKKRQRRAKEEKRREKRIEAEENRKMGKYPVPNLHLESNIQFPEFGFEARLRTQSECTLPSDRSTSPDLLSSSNVSVETTYSGPSFAAVSMRREQPPSWPSLKPSTSSEPVKTSYVTESKTKASNSGQVRNDSDEEYNSAPSYTNSFNEALEIAFQLAKKKPESEAAATPGKKKKKGKNVIIATNMAFCGKN